ncbi:hypothetical protein [Microbispora sp. NPDC049125]|uniref:hypothetical protein n=1 Tax=Microbispora sp. NPDC049125 TaxID=3154929 RepID=UPI003466EB7A
MPATRPFVLLLSSNHRRRYAEDVLSALALPRGALIQFRYEADYVVPSLQQMIADRSVVGRRCLLGFVADVESPSEPPSEPPSESLSESPSEPPSQSPSQMPFVVPVRFASVVGAVCVADLFLFRLRVEEYANVEELPLTEAGIRAEGRRFVDKLAEANGHRYYPATARFPDLHLHEGGGDDPQLWLGVARRLAKHPTFRSSYFVRIEEPTLTGDRKVRFDASGRLTLSDRMSVKMRVSFYCDRYSETTKRLVCATDGTYLKTSSDDSCDVALSYDAVEFWLQPAMLGFDALTRVTVRLEESKGAPSPAGDSLTTRAGFPVIVRRSRSRLLTRVAASSAGAFLVALPAVVGLDFPLPARVLSAVAGAALLAFATIVVPRAA